MKKSVVMLGFAAAAVGVGLLGVARPAQGQTTTHRTTKSTAKTTTEAYTVIQVGAEYKVVRTSTMNDEKKRIAEDNKKALAEWQDAVKADPQVKKPAPLVIRIIKAGFKTQKGADDFVTKLKEKEKDEGKDAKDTGDTKTAF